ncbi:MAG: hypothetical protein VCC19_11625 [Myxococcota bacterium]
MKTSRKTTSYGFGGFALLSGLMVLLCSLPALAETPLDLEDPLAGLTPMADESLDEARGGAVTLPNGMTMEVTASMRVLLDGQEQAPWSGSEIGAPSLDLATQLLDLNQHGMVVNSLNNVSLEHYREINFLISNLPASVTSPTFMPDPIIHDLSP